jgi:biopolymer transport protein ExbD
MPNVLTNYTSADVGTSPTTLYTVPAATTGTIVGLNVANTTTSQIAVDVQVAGVYVIKGAPIPANSALSVLDGKLVVKSTETVVVTSDAATSVDAILSVLEQS